MLKIACPIEGMVGALDGTLSSMNESSADVYCDTSTATRFHRRGLRPAPEDAAVVSEGCGFSPGAV
jgi:hypothetical protein